MSLRLGTSASDPNGPPPKGGSEKSSYAILALIEKHPRHSRAFSFMAPGGVEPPRTDSKSVALSAELRGLRSSVAASTAKSKKREGG